jgi:amino acid permease
VLLPLSLKRDMSAFKYASLLSIACLSYTGIVLIIELPNFYQQNKDSDWKPVYFDLNLLTGASMTFFAF